MLTALEIENFKCFRHLKIEPLAKVNLFVGTSNVGKTSVLEAIDWLPKSDGFTWSRFRDVAVGQGNADEFLKWAFRDARPDEFEIVITSSMIGGFSHSQTMLSAKHREALGAQMRLRSNAPFDVEEIFGGEASTQSQVSGDIWVSFRPTHSKTKISAVSTAKKSSAELARDYDRWTRRAENDDRFVEFLRNVDPRLKSLRPMEHTGTRMLYADVRLPERIALPLLGEGFNRLVQIFGSIIGEEADILLIDEIENGLHWSALPQIWTGVREAVNKEDVQIFATTHSLECIATAVEAFKGEPKNDLAVHRLERRDDGDIHCVTMNEDELERMLGVATRSP